MYLNTHEYAELPAADLHDTWSSEMEAPRRILILAHDRGLPTGRIGQWLRQRDYELDIRCPRFGDSLPETLDGHAGAVILGGAMSVNDPDDYIRREIEWIAVPLKEDKPFFGICLGAQMLAKHLGAEVGTRRDGLVEAGYTPIEVSEAGRAIMNWPSHVYHWHREGFTLPRGAQQLASSTLFENQAFRYGRHAFGVQFHPETTLARMHHLGVSAAHFLSLPGAQPSRAHIAAHNAHGETTRRWLHDFMPLWLGTA